MFTALTARRHRYLVAKIDTTTGTERISRTLEWEATPARVRQLVPEAADGWDQGVLVVDPEPGTRIYVLPHIDGVVTRWDDLIRAHRQRTLLEMAERAVAALGQAPGPDTELLARWIAAGAVGEPPKDVPALVPEVRQPVTDGERLGMERRAQLLAKVLPIAGEIDETNTAELARCIAVGLFGP
jgi:hypothetical protein